MNSISKKDALKIAKDWEQIALTEDNVALLEDMIELKRYIKNSLRLDELKEKGFWEEGEVTHMIDDRHYPHDFRCEDSMCWCVSRAKKENPKKYEQWLKKRRKLYPIAKVTMGD